MKANIKCDEVLSLRDELNLADKEIAMLKKELSGMRNKDMMEVISRKSREE